MRRSATCLLMVIKFMKQYAAEIDPGPQRPEKEFHNLGLVSLGGGRDKFRPLTKRPLLFGVDSFLRDGGRDTVARQGIVLPLSGGVPLFLKVFSIRALRREAVFCPDRMFFCLLFLVYYFLYFMGCFLSVVLS